jgi:hypothetical protein
MQMISVKSSAISYIGYDSDTKQMKITFKQGKTYDYCGVPQSVFDAFLKASSIGKYYDQYIKDNYNCF